MWPSLIKEGWSRTNRNYKAGSTLQSGIVTLIGLNKTRSNQKFGRYFLIRIKKFWN